MLGLQNLWRIGMMIIVFLIWVSIAGVKSDSYLDLQKKIGDKRFFEKLNQNKY